MPLFSEVKRARAFAARYLRDLGDDHTLYVGAALHDEVDGDAPLIYVFRDDAAGRRLDERAVAADIEAAFGGGVRFRGDYCK